MNKIKETFEAVNKVGSLVTDERSGDENNIRALRERVREEKIRAMCISVFK